MIAPKTVSAHRDGSKGVAKGANMRVCLYMRDSFSFPANNGYCATPRHSMWKSGEATTLALLSLGILDTLVSICRDRGRDSLCCLLDDADFCICQAVERVDELVDLLVGYVDLTLEGFLVV